MNSIKILNLNLPIGVELKLITNLKKPRTNERIQRTIQKTI